MKAVVRSSRLTNIFSQLFPLYSITFSQSINAIVKRRELNQTHQNLPKDMFIISWEWWYTGSSKVANKNSPCSENCIKKNTFIIWKIKSYRLWLQVNYAYGCSLSPDFGSSTCNKSQYIDFWNIVYHISDHLHFPQVLSAVLYWCFQTDIFPDVHLLFHSLPLMKCRSLHHLSHQLGHPQNQTLFTKNRNKNITLISFFKKKKNNFIRVIFLKFFKVIISLVFIFITLTLWWKKKFLSTQNCLGKRPHYYQTSH